MVISDDEFETQFLGEGGLFQGVGAGGTTARRAFAATMGKKTLADKTKIWL